jgi:hypothetical protein
MSLTTSRNGDVTLSKSRHDVCLEIAYELEALAFVLPGLVPNIDEAHGAHHAVRGVAGRFVTLANALMSGLGDDVEKTERLGREVFVTPFSRES